MDIFNRLGYQNVAKIIAALTSNQHSHPIKNIDTIGVDKQKWTILKYADSMSVESKKTICNIIALNNKRGELKEGNDNRIIVNLDNLPNHIIEQLYIFIVCKNEY